MKKISQKTITGVIQCVSGIRIGGSDDLLQIGGTDLTCIKHPVTLQPYIPGSSIKGKMRSELEKKLGQFGGPNGNEPCGCGSCVICRVFGPHKNPTHSLGPTRIIVRDASLKSGGELETKSENIIDRKTGTAQHPRKVERVAAGSTFNLKVSLQVWDMDNSASYAGKSGGDALVELVKDGLLELTNTGLGGGVSKGYGEIELLDLKLDGQPFTLSGQE
jgi:CRISPR-associated protein Csm3